MDGVAGEGELRAEIALDLRVGPARDVVLEAVLARVVEVVHPTNEVQVQFARPRIGEADVLVDEIAAAAARLVVDEGMEYAGAKRKAQRALGRHAGRIELPSNEQVEDQVRDYLSLFCADTQPAELHALRTLALIWMERLAEFRPHLTGAVWRGTATRLSAIHLDLYCDDTKSTEITLILSLIHI